MIVKFRLGIFRAYKAFTRRRWWTTYIPCLFSFSLACAGCGGGSGTNIVSPPPPPLTYLISGTVSGLTGGPLELGNNGTDELNLSSNGMFAFSRSINNGDTYDVIVSL
jgi:hypothetical protein